VDLLLPCALREAWGVTVASMSADYCELCDLPLSQCIHGRPPPPPPAPVKKPSTAVRRSTAKTAAATTAAPAKRVQRKWTPPEEFRPHILAVLQDAGGELEADEVFLELEIRVEDSLLAGDRETTPEGELRWRYAARRARQALVAEGLMASGKPGVWALTTAGRRTPAV
jgi:hypothetical protein